MLKLKQINKEYKTGELVQHALNNVSLNLRDNEFVAILGPSGSGKTTLVLESLVPGLNAAIHQITKALVEGEKIQIVGFGAFETKVRAERMGRTPKTGENIPLPATKIPAFKAGKALKDAVDQ